jgi:hypothetical protein
MNDTFIPTYLYIKQHTRTGLLYFGKTIRKDPETYSGSGTYWKDHIKKHGKHINTLWYELFFNEKDISEFAISFSTEMNIIKSNSWANLILEEGVNQPPSRKGIPRTSETKKKISIANIGKTHSQETKELLSEIAKNRPRIACTEETKKKISDAQKGIHKSEESIQKMKEAIRPKLTIEHKEKIRLSILGRTHSEESIQKMRIPKSVSTCPHCGKTGGTGALTRWHFANCKLAPASPI